MSDLERELRELRDRISEETRPSPGMAEQVFRRARIRRAVTATTGLLVIVIVGFSSLVAAGALTGREPTDPIAPTPSESPSPTETPSPEVGRDIGLGFPVCDLSRLRGIDLLGDGSDGTAWTATTIGDNGHCQVRKTEDAYLVAVDVTGDGKADAWWEALEWCVFCEPYGVVDFDGDGAEELVVLVQGGSVTQYQVFSARIASDGSIEFEPIRVAPPGNRKGDLPAGEPISFWVGGDEGYSSSIACENHPENPVVVLGWTNHPIDGEPKEVHITRLALREGAFEVIDALNTEQPTDDPPPDGFPTGDDACGLDFDPTR